MKCLSCGHEIADNAIVCYRCGTPTAVPPPARPAMPPPRGGRRWLVTAVVVAIAILVGLVVGLAWHLL